MKIFSRLIFIGIASFSILACLVTSVVGGAPYRDSNSYFTFTPPEGWILQEFPDEARRKIQCQSLDGEAVIGIIARPREGGFEDLLEGQKGFLNTQRKFFPENKYIMSETFMCGFRSSKIELEVPRGMKQEFYVFLAGNLSFNVTYAALSAEAFEKHNEEAFTAISSLRPIRQD